MKKQSQKWILFNKCMLCILKAKYCSLRLQNHNCTDTKLQLTWKMTIAFAVFGAGLSY